MPALLAIASKMPSVLALTPPSLETATAYLSQMRGWLVEVAVKQGIWRPAIQPVVRLAPTKASQYYVAPYLPPMPPLPTPVSFPEIVRPPELELSGSLPLLWFLLLFVVVASLAGVSFYQRFLIEEERRQRVEAQRHTEILAVESLKDRRIKTLELALARAAGANRRSLGNVRQFYQGRLKDIARCHKEAMAKAAAPLSVDACTNTEEAATTDAGTETEGHFVSQETLALERVAADLRLEMARLNSAAHVRFLEREHSKSICERDERVDELLEEYQDQIAYNTETLRRLNLAVANPPLSLDVVCRSPTEPTDESHLFPVASAVVRLPPAAAPAPSPSPPPSPLLDKPKRQRGTRGGGRKIRRAAESASAAAAIAGGQEEENPPETSPAAPRPTAAVSDGMAASRWAHAVSE